MSKALDAAIEFLDRAIAELGLTKEELQEQLDRVTEEAGT